MSRGRRSDFGTWFRFTNVVLILNVVLTLNVVIAHSAQASTFYIDFASGADSNAGASTATPWKHAPGMQGCSGNCAAKTPQPGDRFIFKGGVTWDHTCFEMDLNWSGTAGNPIYYGVDKTWYAGTAWSRPVFSADHVALPFGGPWASIIGAGSQSYITLDNLELKGHHAMQNQGTGSIAYGCMTYFIMQNLYVHDWELDNSFTTDDTHGGILGYPNHSFRDQQYRRKIIGPSNGRRRTRYRCGVLHDF
jgi:hypothetical protein